MINNYLKITWRSLQKNPLYSFVNIVGLTIGITGCILIGIFVWNEISYDKFHANADRIARVTMEYSSGGSVGKTAVTGSKVGPEFLRQFPQVAAYSRTIKIGRSVANGPTVFDEKNVLYADADFFKIFSFELLRGDKATVLNGANKIVLTPKIAEKYFGKTDPIGKTLRFNDAQDFEVTGIVEDAPLNSQVQFDMIPSFGTLNAAKNEEWWSANYITYVLTQKDGQIPELQQRVSKHMAAVSKGELFKGSSDYLTYNLEPLKTVHLNSSLDGLEPNGNITYIYVLSAIALLILLIACVNYTNLATAQSAGRSTEIGIRKVLGAGKKELFRQFIAESFLLTLIALVLALVISILLLPVFNGITGKIFTASLLLQPWSIVAFLLLAVSISLLAGSYPAFILSNSGLISILKSGVRASSSGGNLRRSLIVFQFVISVFLIVSTIVIRKQIAYIQEKDLGYNKEQVVVLPVDYKTKAQYDALKKAMALHPGVLGVSGAYEDPTFVQWSDAIRTEDGKGEKKLSVNAMPVDVGFLKTMGMQIIAGSDFTNADFLLHDTSDDYNNYRNSYIINQKAAAELGWTPEQAVGKTIAKNHAGKVKAVIKDFNYSSMHETIGPLVMFLDSSQVQEMFVKISSQNIPGTLKALESTWKSRITHRPFNYHFLDEVFAALYSTEQRTARLFTLFSCLAIALACLGLFALAAFTTVQRTREIGIRKVLGAGIKNIALLISAEFVRLVLIAVVIASPFAWLASRSWLQNFAYRIDISWWMFGVAALMAILIAVGTVSYHAIKAALANPVKSLRTE